MVRLQGAGMRYTLSTEDQQQVERNPDTVVCEYRVNLWMV